MIKVIDGYIVLVLGELLYSPRLEELGHSFSGMRHGHRDGAGVGRLLDIIVAAALHVHGRRGDGCETNPVGIRIMEQGWRPLCGANPVVIRIMEQGQIPLCGANPVVIRIMEQGSETAVWGKPSGD